MSNPILQRLIQHKAVPVVKIESAAHADGLGKALLKGDLPVAEITFRTDAAAKSINILAEKHPDILVGAGTIINPEQAEKAIKAGARFIVCPGYTDEVVEYCRKRHILVVPGVATPTEVQYGLSKGIQLFKLFPAEISGGVRLLDSLRGPFPQVQFIPTGGINMDNAADYMRRENVIAVGGSWMVPSDLIAIEDWDSITRLAQLALQAVQA